MSIRNAAIARRNRKIGLFEQERIAYIDYGLRPRSMTPVKTKKKDDSQSKKAVRAFWQDN